MYKPVSVRSFFHALSPLIWIALSLSACKPDLKVKQVEDQLRLINEKFVPDSRVAVFEVTADRSGNTIVLNGQTNLPEAKYELLSKLAGERLEIKDQIRLLPDTALSGSIYGLPVNSVINLRTQPRHAAELATQALLGTPLRIFEKNGSWYRVQTPDNYIAWVDSAAIFPMSQLNYDSWLKTPKVIFTQVYGSATAQPEAQAAMVADVVLGSVFEMLGQRQGFYKVALPDGRTAWLDTAQAEILENWLENTTPDADRLVATAFRLMGVPYLWGGTSAKGMDCSGFTKTIYLMNGIVIPRDASQQVNTGVEIDTVGNFANLLPGDLLFFGRPATNEQAERVIHVGMWIGEQQFIHASGRVRVSSFEPNAPNFDEFELKRFLRVKRVNPGDTANLSLLNRIYAYPNN